MGYNLKAEIAIYGKGEIPKWRETNSFLKNFSIPFKMIVGGTADRSGINYDEIGAKDIDGNAKAIRDIGSASARSFGREPKIHIGDKLGPKPPSAEDFRLESELASAPASTSPPEGEGVNAAEKRSYFDVWAVVALGEEKNVTEIGLSTLLPCADNHEHRFMLLRDIVTPPFTFEIGTPYILRYRLVMEA